MLSTVRWAKKSRRWWLREKGEKNAPPPLPPAVIWNMYKGEMKMVLSKYELKTQYTCMYM